MSMARYNATIKSMIGIRAFMQLPKSVRIGARYRLRPLCSLLPSDVQAQLGPIAEARARAQARSLAIAGPSRTRPVNYSDHEEYSTDGRLTLALGRDLHTARAQAEPLCAVSRSPSNMISSHRCQNVSLLRRAACLKHRGAYEYPLRVTHCSLRGRHQSPDQSLREEVVSTKKGQNTVFRSDRCAWHAWLRSAFEEA